MTHEIQDLDFWEVQDSSKPVSGGFYSQVNAVANTDFNFASAGVESIALGEKRQPGLQHKPILLILPFLLIAMPKPVDLLMPRLEGTHLRTRQLLSRIRDMLTTFKYSCQAAFQKLN